MIDLSMYLAPAKVTAVQGAAGRVHVQTADGEPAWARWACSGPYEPVAGDEVLVLGRDPSELYVVGVLRAHGPVHLKAGADLKISAPHGKVTVASRDGLRLETEGELTGRAASMKLQAGTMEFTASRITQAAREFYGWFSGLLQFKSRRLRAAADETIHLKSSEVHLRSDKDFFVNGDTINLG